MRRSEKRLQAIEATLKMQGNELKSMKRSGIVHAIAETAGDVDKACGVPDEEEIAKCSNALLEKTCKKSEAFDACILR